MPWGDQNRKKERKKKASFLQVMTVFMCLLSFLSLFHFQCRLLKAGALLVLFMVFQYFILPLGFFSFKLMVVVLILGA